MDELLYTVWLSLSCTPGTETFSKLLGRFSSPIDIYSADAEDISACIGSSSRDYNLLLDKSTKRAEKIIDFCNRKSVGILSYFDKDFPASLKAIKNPPVLLYYRGNLPRFNERMLISVVGTRRLTDYGRKNAFTVSHDLARAGAVIVSGMAHGIDGVALAGAVCTGEPTVAVLGSGIDVCYPSQHKRLAQEIVKNGCVLTEYAPGTRPERYNFPVRNRIISGLSAATLVVEGNENSGALITARRAFEQGRRVYALPGNVGNANSEASNLLIKNGAGLFTCADDIVRDYDKISPGKLNPFKLAEPVMLDQREILLELEVSCVAPSDEIFRPARKKKSKEEEKSTDTSPQTQKAVSQKGEDVLPPFDKKTVEIYKRIPIDTECSVEDLIDENYALRDVMQGLLKLEIARFVVMLPGDRVKRNLK